MTLLTLIDSTTGAKPHSNLVFRSGQDVPVSDKYYGSFTEMSNILTVKPRDSSKVFASDLGAIDKLPQLNCDLSPNTPVLVTFTVNWDDYKVNANNSVDNNADNCPDIPPPDTKVSFNLQEIVALVEFDQRWDNPPEIKEEDVGSPTEMATPLEEHHLI